MLDTGNRAANETETRRSSELGIESPGNPDDRPEVSDGFGRKFLHTLPRTFKSLRGRPIGIASEDPPELIESLGDVLEIADYKTNMASFWFLDTLALQVHRHKGNLDDYYLSVLISWLAGEMSLIRDKKLSREEFLLLMKEMFRLAANAIAEKKRCPYWDEIELDEGAKEIDEEDETMHSTDSGDDDLTDLEGISIKKQSRDLQNNLDKKQPSSNDQAEDTDAFFSNIDPLSVLDIIMESTYNMYANELRYFLVYSVFVESIEVQSYRLPFALKTPRPVKLLDPNSMPFNIELHKKFEKFETANKLKERGKAAIGRGKKKNVLAVPETPLASLVDEEILIEKRKFILPLIEANETMEIFDMLEEVD